MYNKEREMWLIKHEINQALDLIDYYYYVGINPPISLIKLVDDLINEVNLLRKGKNAK